MLTYSNIHTENVKESGTPGESRTPNLLIRSQALYPIELRVQIAKYFKIAKPMIGASEFKYQPAKKPDYLKLRKIREALCPPKPELLLIATFTVASRASLGT